MLKNDKLDAVQLGLLNEGIVEIAGDVDQEMAWYAREALQRLRARRATEVTVHITSGGGKIVYGLDIYDMLRLFPGRVTGVVYGAAVSAAAIILQGCAIRKSARHRHRHQDR
jgi:ATP-dependent protease ClpP protease subunit